MFNGIVSKLQSAGKKHGKENLVVVMRVGKNVPYQVVEELNKNITERAGIGKVRHNSEFKE